MKIIHKFRAAMATVRFIGLNIAYLSNLLCITSYAQNQTVKFSNPNNFSTGNNPNSLAVGDLDGNGNTFLALTTSATNDISIMIGNGLGEFSAPQTFPSRGVSPNSIIAGDFNHDGNSDLVVTAAPIIVSHLGDGTGRFPISSDVYNGLNAITAPTFGDFNGDEILDLAGVFTVGFRSVSILLGDSQGSFRRFGNFFTTPTSTSIAVSLATGDMDGDGNVDLVVANDRPAQISILWGDGSGEFFNSSVFGVGANPSSVAVADFNNDGKLDIVTTNQGTNNVAVILSLVARRFQNPSYFAVGSIPKSVIVGDFSGDDLLDLAVANQGSDNISILVGDGKGKFSGPFNFIAGNNPIKVVAEDFDKDQNLDLVVANQGSANVSILLNLVEGQQFRISNIFPNKGGDIGTVSTLIHGRQFKDGATVTLLRSGEIIVGAPVIVSEDGRTINATFDLTRHTQGLWDVVVRNPNDSTAVLADGFTIEKGRVSEVWVDVLGRNVIRLGRPTRYTIVYGNNGNVDAYGTPVWLAGIPKSAKFKFITEISSPSQFQEDPINWEEIPFHIEAGDEFLVPFLIPLIPPGYQGAILMELTTSTIDSFELRAGFSDPLIQNLGSDNNTDLQVCIEGAMKFAFNKVLEKVLPDKCAREGYKLIIDSYQESLNLAFSKPKFWGTVVSYSQIYYKATKVAVVCARETLPVSRIVKIAWEFTLFIDEANNFKEKIETATACLRSLTPHYPAKLNIGSLFAFDPNDKVGSSGFSNERYVSGFQPLRYIINFENLETATAPAQEVVVTDQLDVNLLDLNTLSFGQVIFGMRQIMPFPGLRQFRREIDLRPSNNLIVRVELSVNIGTGMLTARLISLDPATGLPPEDPLAGFLPPNIKPPEGEGSILFTVKPKQGLNTGTKIRNSASIVFDTNAPIATPEWFNTLDNDKPMSQLTLISASDSLMKLSWTSSDIGTGIENVSHFVSENGGSFLPWLVTTATDSTVVFKVDSTSKYAFYTQARDRTGNVEEIKEPDIVTSINGASNIVPKTFALFQNYPNPFNPETIITYHLSQASKAKLEIFNVLGERVKTLVDKQQAAGEYSVKWTGENEKGTPVASGLYLCHIEANRFVRTIKMVLLR